MGDQPWGEAQGTHTFFLVRRRVRGSCRGFDLRDINVSGKRLWVHAVLSGRTKERFLGEDFTELGVGSSEEML